MSHGNGIRNLLRRADELGYLTIDSAADKRTYYILDQKDGSAAIVRSRWFGRQHVVIPHSVMREIAEIAKLYC